MDYKMIICTVVSNDYFIYLERLLASARINLPNELFYVLLVNVDKSKVPCLNRLYPGIKVEHEYVKFNSIDEQGGYCTNLRAKLLPKLMLKYDCPVAWIDVDSLFVRPAEEFVSYSYKYDFSLQYSSDHPALNASSKKLEKLPKGPLGTPYYGVFSNGIITTNNSHIAKKFFMEFERKVEKCPYAWNTDQEAMFLTYKEFENRIDFNPLEKKFWDRRYNLDTIIWTLKARLKNNEQYILMGDEYIYKVGKWQATHVINKTKKLAPQKDHTIKKVKIRIKKVLKRIVDILAKYTN